MKIFEDLPLISTDSLIHDLAKEWKIFKVSDSKYHCSSDEQLLDPESDQLLHPQGKDG